MSRMTVLVAAMFAALVSSPANAQYLWQMGGGGAMGLNPALDPSLQPVNFVDGRLPMAGAPATEVATTQAIIKVGDLVPLPTYADGSPAAESEVFWTSAIWRATFSTCCNGPTYSDGDRVLVQYQGRLLANASGVLDDWYYWGGGHGFPLKDISVLVTVVAVRSPGATATSRSTLGTLKVRYR